VSKKTKKPIKSRKPEKNNRKNRIVKKNRLEFLKNQPVQFGLGFISLKLENRTESNQTQTKKNRAKSEKTEPASLNQF
jgi:hypothetical protein